MENERKRAYYERWKGWGGLERQKVRRMYNAIIRKLLRPLLDESYRPVLERKKGLLEEIIKGRKLSENELDKYFSDEEFEIIKKAGGVK